MLGTRIISYQLNSTFHNLDDRYLIAKIVSVVSTRSIHYCDEMKVHAITTGTTFMLLLHCHATALLSNQSQSVACAGRTYAREVQGHATERQKKNCMRGTDDDDDDAHARVKRPCSRRNEEGLCFKTKPCCQRKLHHKEALLCTAHCVVPQGRKNQYKIM